MSNDQRFIDWQQQQGLSCEGEIKIGGNYEPIVQDGDTLYVSGQIPRLGDDIVYIGAAGADHTLPQAQRAAAICTLRALALVQRALGTLDHIQSVPRISVFVRSSPDFTQQSEVANGASDALIAVLGPNGRHTRTSVGVLQLPKGALVEVDFVFKVGAGTS